MDTKQYETGNAGREQMRKYCWRKVVLPMALFCIFVFHTEVLAEVDKLRINQMIQNGNNVFLYVSVLEKLFRQRDSLC